MAVRLDEEQMARLGEMLRQDAANPAPVEEGAPPDEASADEVDTLNENAEAAGEMEADAADTEAVPDPNAEADPQTPAAPAAPALPEGIESVEQLVGAYNQLMEQANRRGDDMQALRDMNSQLVSIAEALGFGKELAGMDLHVDDKMRSENPMEAARREIQQEFRNQLKPLVEQQQKNLRDRLVDRAWKEFAGGHEDISELMDDIRKIIGESPELAGDENGLQVAYHLARSGRYRPEKNMMDDDDFVSRAAQNPKIKEKVIEEYLRQVSKGDEAPATVGGGGKAVPTGRKKAPMTIQEAHKAFERMANR